MRPNLFIVGAPKCGTSSLFDWMTNHPDIRGSRVKEPFFLTDPDHPLSRRPNLAHDGMAAYDTLFAPEDVEAPIRMEATTHYLFDPVARKAIADMADARVIIVLREPAARVYSSFQYTANNLARVSKDLTFDRYVDLLASGESLFPGWCTHEGSAYVLQRDKEYSRYARYVEPWIQALGRDRIKILIMETMINDPDTTVSDVVGWLGLDSDRMLPLNRSGRNRTEQVRSPVMQGLARRINARIRPPEPVRRLAKRAYGAVQFRKPVSLNPVDATTLERLKAEYVPDIAELSCITGMDFSAWSSVAKVADERQPV